MLNLLEYRFGYQAVINPAVGPGFSIVNRPKFPIPSNLDCMAESWIAERSQTDLIAFPAAIIGLPII